MSALDILRSFAEARCADHEPIPARLTYGTIREVLRIIEEWERSAELEEVARLEEQSSGSWVRLKDPRDLDPGTLPGARRREGPRARSSDTGAPRVDWTPGGTHKTTKAPAG